MTTDVGTRLMKIKIGTVEHTAECSRIEITSSAGDSDFVSFEDAANGGKREYALEITAKQATDSAALWRYVWANTGDTMAVKVNPHGNATSSTDEPHYTGNVTITEPDGTLIGGEAKSSTSARQTISVRWVFTAKPTEDTAGTAF